MAGRMIEFESNGGKTMGYLASPATGKGPGVVVVQEWWGLNDQIKGVADMLAREGFNALAPDFYEGKGATIAEPDKAGKLMMGLLGNLDAAAKVARGAARELCMDAGTSSKKVGVIGFCVGGQLALYAGMVAPEMISAIVDCYGVPPGTAHDYAKLRGMHVLGIFGGKDHDLTPEVIAKLGTDLQGAGASFEHRVYPEAGHAFLNEQRPGVHRADDAKDAWGRIVPFLRAHVA